MKTNPTLTIALISYNEEKNIRRTLESARSVADEIILLDHYSTDKTVEIAKGFGAKVYQEEWTDFVTQKNSLFDKCTTDWILNLDCDEVLSDELIDEIKEAIKSDEFSSYYLDRKTVYLGRKMKYAWQPDWQLRLVRREAKPKWVGLVVHESIEIDGKAGRLKGELLHYSYRDIAHHMAKTLEYSKISAEQYKLKGKKFKLSKLMLNPIIAFCRLYIFRRGFLDGVPGLIAGFSTFMYTFLKYAMLFEKSNKS
jgi:glycosyltransferase involved in cell wall biosynthesis